MEYLDLVGKIKDRIKYYESLDNTDLGFFLDYFENRHINNLEKWYEIRVSDIIKMLLCQNKEYNNLPLDYLEIIDGLTDDDFYYLNRGIIENNSTKEMAKYLFLQYHRNSTDKEAYTDSDDQYVFKYVIKYDIEKFEIFINNYIKIREKIDLNFIKGILEINDEFRNLYNSFINRPKGTILYCDAEQIHSLDDIINIMKNDNIKVYGEIQTKIEELLNYGKSIIGDLTNKKIRKIINNYQILLSLLEKEKSKEEITSIDEILNKCLEDDIKGECAEYIYQHNKPYYERLEEEYIVKSSNSVSKFSFYFKNLGLNFDSLTDNLKNKIMEDSLEIVKNKVNIISKLVLPEKYFIVLANNTYDDLITIVEFIKKEYINADFIKANLDILINRDVQNNLKDNIQELLVYKLNFKRYENKSFLLINNDLLKQNIALLNKLNIPFIECNNLAFLGESLKDKIEKFIEVGLEEYIFSNPDILNADIALADRILITKTIEVDPFENGKLKNFVLYKNDFFVTPNKVGEYLLDRDNSKYNSEMTLYLSNVDATPLSYIIDGIIVPKMRVHTQPVKLVDIIKPSLYTKEEIKKLERSAQK